MTDREERQHVIEVLQNMVDWMEVAHYIVAKPERIHALGYAINSIKTDLKYDLLYEEALEQEPKSEWEHDHEILKAYSDGANEVLDKIRAEIETKYGQCDICEYDAISGWEQVSDIADILQIIDKYKAESEQTDGNDTTNTGSN